MKQLLSKETKEKIITIFIGSLAISTVGSIYILLDYLINK